MVAPPAGHGYIDYDGDRELFWRIETLWDAATGLAAHDVSIDSIPWRNDGCYILGDPPTWGAFADHCRRTLDADLVHPIILGPTGDVVDGMHRIVRAVLDGRTTIAAVRLDEMPTPDRVRPRS